MNRCDVNFDELSPMMKEYYKTKDEYADVLLFYRLGDFYELFFEDAITASHELELTLTGKNAGLKERVPMCGVPHHAVNIYLDKLIEKGYKVAICEQVEDPKLAKGLVKREVTQIVSKGTITNTDNISENDFNYIASLSQDSIYFTIVYCDILSGKIYGTKILKNTDKLISKISNLNIKELVVSKTFDKEIIHLIRKTNDTFVSYIDDTTNTYENVTGGILDYIIVSTANNLLSYVENNLKKELVHFSHLEIINNDEYLELNRETIRNLEIIETLRNGERTYSLLWLLDKTKTAMGSRFLKKELITPLKSKNDIEYRQNLIEEFNREFLLTSELKEYLYEIYDLERLIGKIVCSVVNARDLIQLKNSIKVLPNINEILRKLNLEELETFNELYEKLEDSIDLDAPVTIKEGNIIKPGFNEELDELRNIRKNGKDFISKFENEEKERTGIKTLKVGYNKVFGYYIEVSKGQIGTIKEEFGYVRKQTTSNSERYITPLLKEKEDLILNAEDKINKLEYDIFNEIKDYIKDYITSLQNVSNKIAFYDFICALSTVSEENNFVKPMLTNNNELEIIDGRHPVVEKVIKNEYVTNDIIMNKDTNILMITGPNMSGKSTYMRQLAIIVILNQIGSFVPCKSAKLPIFDKIFTRIGASDDLVGGESTFMVEMNESASALRNATENSLLIFDELGRGTSTYDGMALAGAIIDYISKHIKCKTLFSTHYHELTKLSEINTNIKNVHVSVKEDNGDISFLHKIENGPADKSYGINVAKLANLPKEVIIKANELLNEYESNTNKPKQKQMELDLTNYEEKDELKEFINSINPLNITPMEALNILIEIKKKYN